MQKEGIIDFFTVVTNAKKLNKTVTAFVFVVMQYGDSIASLLEYAQKSPVKCMLADTIPISQYYWQLQNT